MSEEHGSEHCYIQRLLTPEEIERVRRFLRQQGIHLPDSRSVGMIGEVGTIKACPFRYGFGEQTTFCANTCHLTSVFGEHKA